MTTPNITNDSSNIARVFNIGSPKLLIWFNSQYPEATLKFCRKDEKLLAYSRKWYLWTEHLQCYYRFQTFQTEMKFWSFWKKNLSNLHRSKEKTHVAWLVLAQKNYPLKSGSRQYFMKLQYFCCNWSIWSSRKELHKTFSINGLYYIKIM